MTAMPSLNPIGLIKTPYRTLKDCPRNIDPKGPLCELVIDKNFAGGVLGLTPGQEILVLYWFEDVDRNITSHPSRKYGGQRGVFAMRTPVRPNPIAAAVVKIENIDNGRLSVKGLDCLDGTPLLDIKPAILKERSNILRASRNV